MNDDENIAQELGHEPIGVSARNIAFSIALLMGVIVASLLIIGGLTFALSRVWEGWATVNAPPGPKEPDDQRAAFRALRDTENKLLTEYGWVDEQAGVARLPIARAMAIEAERLGALQQTDRQESGDERTSNNP